MNNNIELRDYLANNAPVELRDKFYIPHKMETKPPREDVYVADGTLMHFTSRQAAIDAGYTMVTNVNLVARKKWIEEKERIEEVLWRYNYADHMIKYGKTDLTPKENKTLLRG